MENTFVIYNLFGEPICDNDDDTKMSSLDLDFMFGYGLQDLLKLQEKITISYKKKRKYKANKNVVSPICLDFLKKYGDDKDKIYMVEKCGIAYTDVSKWFKQKCQSKSDLLLGDKDGKYMKKISLKNATGPYQLTSSKINCKQDNCDLVQILNHVYGKDVDWVKDIKSFVNGLNDYEDVFKAKGHLTEIVKSVGEKKIEGIKNIGLNIENILRKRIYEDPVKCTAFLEEILTGKIKFGEDSPFSADGFVLINTDTKSVIYFEDVSSYIKHIKEHGFDIYFSFKTYSNSHPSYSFRVVVEK